MSAPSRERNAVAMPIPIGAVLRSIVSIWVPDDVDSLVETTTSAFILPPELSDCTGVCSCLPRANAGVQTVFHCTPAQIPHSHALRPITAYVTFHLIVK